MQLKEFDEDNEFPEKYEIKTTIKAPLNVLWYNINSVFIDNYPAKMPCDFARDMINLYSKKGDVVYDGFCGSGTVPRLARKMERYGLGSDINPKAIELCKQHDVCDANIYWVQDLKTVKLSTKAKLILTSPPFGISIGGDKNKYSNEKEDLSTSKTIEEFLKRIEPCFESYYDNLETNGLLIFDSRDRTKNSLYYDLNRIFANICEKIGFKVHAKYFYFLMPWSLYTYKNKENKQIVPNVSTMDVYVMYKPDKSQPLEVFG